jgi:hypothetical protein
MPLKAIEPVETQINPSADSEKENNFFSSIGRAMSRLVITRPPVIQSSVPIKCSVNRWDLGKEDEAEHISMGNMLIRMHTQNSVTFVTLSMESTGAIVVSDNVGPLTKPRWIQASGVLRVCLFNRLNQLGVYDLSFSDTKEGNVCESLFHKGGAMWVRELVRTRLPKSLIEAFSDGDEELRLPIVPQEAERFMAYPPGFHCDEAWKPANYHMEVKDLGDYSKALLEIHANGQEIALGPVTAIIRLSGHSGRALSARFVAISCLDPRNTELVDIELADENAVFVDTQSSGDDKIVVQLPSRGMTLSFFYDSVELHQDGQKCAQPSLSEWVEMVNQAQSQVLSGNSFVARRRARVVELETLITEAKVRHSFWFEEQAVINIANEKARKAAAEAIHLSKEDISGILKGWINTPPIEFHALSFFYIKLNEYDESMGKFVTVRIII